MSSSTITTVRQVGINQKKRSRSPFASPDSPSAHVKKDSKKGKANGSGSIAMDPYLPTSFRPDDMDDQSELSLPGKIVELERLLFAMMHESSCGNGSSNGSGSQNWNALLMRADMARHLWNQMADELQTSNVEQWQALQKQVEQACQKAAQDAIVAQQQITMNMTTPSSEAAVDATMRRVFQSERSRGVQSSPNTPQLANSSPNLNYNNEKQNDQDEESENENDKTRFLDRRAPTTPVSTPASVAAVAPMLSSGQASPTTPNVQDIQRAQREQIEEAIQLMAARMKEETARIHSTLKDQTQGILTQMEDVATENVQQVSAVTKDVQDHVSKNWSKTIGTWTLLFTIIGTFLFCLVTIFMVPKREGACLFFCQKQNPNQFCRVLPSGRKECIDIQKEETPTPKTADASAFNKVGIDEVEPTAAKKECVLGFDGECIDLPIKKDDAPKPIIVAEDKNPDSVFSTDHIPKDTAAEEIPKYNGKFFAPSDVRKAAATGNLEALSGMLQLRPDWVDVQDANGWTALHLASRAGNEDMARFLLNFGSNPLAETTNGRTPLDVAYGKFGLDHSVTILLEQAVEKSKPKPKEPTAPQFTGADLRAAADQGNLGRVSQIVVIKSNLINDQDKDGWTALHYAARAGKADVVKFLLEAGCDYQLETIEGNNALSVAYDRHGKDHAVTKLLQAAFPPGTPLIHGKRFVEADVRSAAVAGNLESLMDMVQVKPEWINSQDENGWAALHLAARAGHSNVVEFLLHTSECDAQIKNNSGSTALQVAVAELGKDHRVVQILLESLPSYALLPNGIVFTADDVRFFADRGDLHLLTEMFQSKPEWFYIVDENGWGPLHMATRAGHADVVEFLVETAEVNPELRTTYGQSAHDIALHFWGHDHRIVQFLERVRDSS